MKYILKRLSLLLIVFKFILFYNVSAQSIDETIKFADNQYGELNYKLAIKEYQRALFFSNGDKIEYLYKQIANSNFNIHNYDKAAYYYELSYKTSYNDSLKNELLLKKASCYILNENYDLALLELINFSDSLDIYFENRKNFYYAVIYFGLEDFEVSKSYFLKIFNDKQLLEKQQIELIFDKKKNFNNPNPKFAKLISFIVPGSGQLYSGNFKNGLNSLILTSGIAVLGIYIAQYYSVFDAILSTAPWFFRYYVGGAQNSKKIALNKRAKRRDKTYKKILNIIKTSNN